MSRCPVCGGETRTKGEFIDGPADKEATHTGGQKGAVIKWCLTCLWFTTNVNEGRGHPDELDRLAQP